LASALAAYNAEPDPAKAEVYARHMVDLMGRGLRSRVGLPSQAGPPISGLSPSAGVWANDNRSALQQQGIPVAVTSATRTPAHNAAVGGAQGSQHLAGKAIDISLTGLTPPQQQQVVSQFLSDPRTGGFGYYPNSNSIHVDVRQGDKAVWGTDYHSTSVGKGWPSWLTSQAMTWQASSRGTTNVTPLRQQGQTGAPVYPRTGYTQPSELGQEASPSEGVAIPPARTAPGVQAQSSQQPTSPSAATEQPSSEHPATEVIQRALPPEKLQMFTRALESARGAKIAEQVRVQKAQEQARKDASANLESRIFAVTKMTGQAPLTLPEIISMGPAGSNEIDQPTVEKLVKISEEVDKRGADKDASKYGPGYYGLFTDIQSGKVSDPGQIAQHYLDHPPGDQAEIYPAGVQELKKIIKENHDKGEDAAVNAVKKGMLDYARNKMVVEEDFGVGPKIRNPAGADKFNSEFIPAFQFGFKKWQEANPNKDPSEFLNRKHMDEMVNQIYPEHQKNAELIGNRQGDVAEPPGTPLPPTPEGITQQGWKTVMASTPRLESGQPMSHATWAKRINMLIADPSPQMIKAFDEAYGESGFTAADVIGKLNPAAVEGGATSQEPGGTEPGFFGRMTGAVTGAASGFIERERAKRAGAGAEPAPGEPSHFGSFLEGERAKQQAAQAGPNIEEELKALETRENALKRSGLGGAFLAAQQRQIDERRAQLMAEKEKSK
jgi:Peptidase M15